MISLDTELLLISLLIKLTEAFQRRGGTRRSKGKSSLPETSSWVSSAPYLPASLPLSPFQLCKIQDGTGGSRSPSKMPKPCSFVHSQKLDSLRNYQAPTQQHITTHVKVRLPS